MKRLLALILVLLLSVTAFCSCGGESIYYVEISVIDYGTITLELYTDIAPRTVKNFVKLVNEGFYDGLTFHRVIYGFMIQGGCPNGDGT